MSNNVYFEDSIDKLNIGDNLLKQLNYHKVSSIGDLWKLSRKQLKAMDISDHDINQIVIKLQLSGIDLNKKIYGKD